MRASLPDSDLQPWYRQFWPWFLIALPATVVVAAFATLFIANRHADDLVVDEYYKDGLAINRRLEKNERAGELGISVQLQLHHNEILASTSGPVQDAQLRLRLSHPLESSRDLELTLSRYADGEYSAQLPAVVEPRWHWTLDAGQDSGWRLDGSLTAADFRDPDGP